MTDILIFNSQATNRRALAGGHPLDCSAQGGKKYNEKRRRGFIPERLHQRSASCRNRDSSDSGAPFPNSGPHRQGGLSENQGRHCSSVPQREPINPEHADWNAQCA